MPLKLIPPRAGKTPFWYVRGSYLGQRVDRSTQARKKPVASKILKRFERDIECGRTAAAGDLTFAGAALAYMNAGGDRNRMKPLLQHLGSTPLSQVDQVAIDNAAAALFPASTPQTRNREAYTPISAVLKRAGVDFKIKRPKGWRGVPRTRWLEKDQAFAAFKGADLVDKEFGLFIRVLCYTGLRLGEVLSTSVDQLNLQDSYLQVLNSKTGTVMGVHLPPVLVAALANHPRGLARQGRIFRFRKSGRLYKLLRLTEKKSGVAHLGFHLFRHTWATWMRRHAGMDIAGLLSTERWKDPASARRYQHVVVSEESKRADLLPIELHVETGKVA